MVCTVLGNSNMHSSLPSIQNVFAEAERIKMPMLMIAGWVWPDQAKHRMFENPEAYRDSLGLKQAIRAELSQRRRIIDHPQLYGWFVWDEPEPESAADSLNIRAINKRIVRELGQRKKLAFINLYPIYHKQFGYGRYNAQKKFSRMYDGYLDSYLSTVNSDDRINVLCVDYYPFFSNTSVRNSETYFHSLDIIRQKSLEHNMPFWLWIQVAKDGQRPFPDVYQIRLQIWTALAYGAKGLSYYRLTPEENVTDAVFNLEDGSLRPGQKERYMELKRLKQEILNLDHELLYLNPVAVYHVDSTWVDNSLAVQRGITDRMLSSRNRVYHIVEEISGDFAKHAMVGYLKHRKTDEDYLLVVNKDYINGPHTFTIQLGFPCRQVQKIDKKSGSDTIVVRDTDTFNCTLAPGEGDLFKIVDETDEYVKNIIGTDSGSDKEYIHLREGLIVIDKKSGLRRYFKE
ncbi:hypothetical protein JW935_20950, partial [candidate division KSB1 bacterium]|nr:hypothetical protein [candidate division KSB1 bacterium]